MSLRNASAVSRVLVKNLMAVGKEGRIGMILEKVEEKTAPFFMKIFGVQNLSFRNIPECVMNIEFPAKLVAGGASSSTLLPSPLRRIRTPNFHRGEPPQNPKLFIEIEGNLSSVSFLFGFCFIFRLNGVDIDRKHRVFESELDVARAFSPPQNREMLKQRERG